MRFSFSFLPLALKPLIWTHKTFFPFVCKFEGGKREEFEEKEGMNEKKLKLECIKRQEH